MNWFENFDRVLRGQADVTGLGLIPAGGASMQEMLEHVRYQFAAKTLEATRDTFPKSIAMMGEEQFGFVWREFQRTNPRSPRSLDEYPEAFLQYVQISEAPHALKELLRFEWALEIHSWSFQALSATTLPALEMTDERRLELAPLDIQYFSAPVMALYAGMEVFSDHEPQTVLFWLTDEGMRFRRLESWEEQVLLKLGEGLGVALETAPDDAEAVTAFFQWLGSTPLIRQLS